MTGPSGVIRQRQQAALADGPSSTAIPRQEATPIVAAAIAAHPASLPPRLTVAPSPRRAGRPPDSQSQTRLRRVTVRDHSTFVQVPLEVVNDVTLSTLDLHVWIWFAQQPEVWKDPAPLELKGCVEALGRDRKWIQQSVARLQASGHVRVTPNPGRARTYSLPWLAVHRLGRRMVNRDS